MITVQVRLVGGIDFDPIEVVATDVQSQKQQKKVTQQGKKVTHDFSFDFDPGPAELQIGIYVPRPRWARKKGTLDPAETEHIDIPLVMESAQPGVYRVKPPNHPPRLVHHVKKIKGKQRTTLLVIDLTFLEVTKYVKELPHKSLPPLLSTDEKYKLDRLTEAKDTTNNPLTSRRPFEAHVRFFELTVGGQPRLWSVTLGPTAKAAKPFHFVVFLIPKTPAYEHPGDANFEPVRRYLASPSLGAPFYVKTKANDGNVWNQPRTFDWNQNPSCGFAEQLWRSGAPVALVLPLPQGTSPNEPRYAVLKTSETTASVATAHKLPHEKGLRPLLDSLRRAILHATSQELPPVRKIRIAVGGFSSGAFDALAVLRANPTNVEQFYWFDPHTDWVKHAEPFLKSWLAGGAHRQLRLVGGNQLAPRLGRPATSNPPAELHLSALHSRLVATAGSTRVSLVPSPGFFETSPVYAAAVAAPRHAGMTSPQKLDRSDSKGTSDVSQVTGVFVERPRTATQPLVLEGRAPNAPPVAPDKRDLGTVSCNETEAAGLMQFKWCQSTDKTQRAAIKKALGEDKYADHVEKFHGHVAFPHLHHPKMKRVMHKDAEKFLNAESDSMRHQWAACGGDGDPWRGDKFVGHLHDCIRRGGF